MTALAAGLYSKKPTSFDNAVKADPIASERPPLGIFSDRNIVIPSLSEMRLSKKSDRYRSARSCAASGKNKRKSMSIGAARL
jgi:hypothetical protein